MDRFWPGRFANMKQFYRRPVCPLASGSLNLVTAGHPLETLLETADLLLQHLLIALGPMLLAQGCPKTAKSTRFWGKTMSLGEAI